MTRSTEQRRLLAVLAAEIVGYRQLMAEDSTDLLSRITVLQGSLIDPTILRNHGHIVKWNGDSFIAMFDSAVDAVRAAIELQSGAAAAPAAQDDRRIQFRMGIDAADGIPVPGDVYGDIDDVAAKLQTLAEPGNIYISRGVRDAVRGKFSVKFENRGELELNNISDTVGAFRVIFDPIAWTGASDEPPAPASLGQFRYVIAGSILLLVSAGGGLWYFVGNAPSRPPTVASTAPRGGASAPATPPASAATRPANSATPSSAAAAPPIPTPPSPVVQAALPLPPGALHDELAAGLAQLLPVLSPAEQENVVGSYEAAQGHKAQAVSLQPHGLWRSAERPSAEDAENSALEDCQVYFAGPCVLAAVDEEAQPIPPDGKWPTRDMARVRYSGKFDPAQIPGAPPNVRERADIAGYRSVTVAKAAAFHPHGGVIFTASGGTQRAAEEAALEVCNADPARKGRDGPCFLYASGDKVVLSLRLTEPMTTAAAARR